MLRESETILLKATKLQGIKLPIAKSEKKQLKRAIEDANPNQPISIYVGSCPDYSHDNGLYTHKSLGEGVPLLSNLHLNNDSKLLELLDNHEVPFRYHLMIADVEGTDNIFCKKFTEDSEEEFLSRCSCSRERTKQLIDDIFGDYRNGVILSSSFFNTFGRERFLAYQESYQQVLEKEYDQNSSLRHRVTDDLIKRMPLYRTMYPDILNGHSGYLSKSQEAFLATRTIRTMAQYLTLGRLVAEDSTHPIIINHPTRNIGLINSRNKFLLPNDDTKPQPTLPVLEMTTEVY